MKIAVALGSLLMLACQPGKTGPETGEDGLMSITSSAFKRGENIPAKFTCDGANVSPELTWRNVPDGAKSLVLLVDDPDALEGTWIHWIVFGIPPEVTVFPEGVPSDSLTSWGIVEGRTSFDEPGYGGPCPPSGTHRYYFRLLALDFVLLFSQRAGISELLLIDASHILAEATLSANYSGP